MSEQLTNRSLEVIGAEIRALTSSMLTNIIEIGRRMVEAKELLPHGEFGPWIKENTGYSHSTANNFMRLFNEYGNPQQSLFGAEVENSQTFGKLSYTKALALLALPSAEEREAFVETHDVDAMSTRELEAAIRERDEARKALQTSEARLADTQRTLSETDKQVTELRGKLQQAWNDVQAADEQATENERELKARIAELESRPVEVAVQEPDPDAVEKRAVELANKAKEELEQQAAKEVGAAEEKAAKAAEALDRAKKQAKAEREKLEARLKEAEAKISAAGEADRAEAEKLRAEADALRKQLAMSSQKIVIFKLRFAAWQAAYHQMTEAFGALDADQQEKMRKAIRAQIQAWGWGNDG